MLVRRGGWRAVRSRPELGFEFHPRPAAFPTHQFGFAVHGGSEGGRGGGRGGERRRTSRRCIEHQRTHTGKLRVASNIVRVPVALGVGGRVRRHILTQSCLDAMRIRCFASTVPCFPGSHMVHSICPVRSGGEFMTRHACATQRERVTRKHDDRYLGDLVGVLPRHAP